MKMGIDDSLVRLWVKHFEAEGLKGLEDKKGKAKGPGMGRPRTRPEDPETKIKRLEAENEILKSSYRCERRNGRCPEQQKVCSD
ncbi:helix-turn-helix domain-containing protein [Paenibacillus albidus]|uniref:helix-turn-helix domain-containing protein n=1 Tax=Paenibacillus albidus TaxID=2041023 RepID=UPI002889F1D8|nr:helix-turn-helix domain-containing protein [Paenibacillus albidus]